MTLGASPFPLAGRSRRSRSRLVRDYRKRAGTPANSRPDLAGAQVLIPRRVQRSGSRLLDVPIENRWTPDHPLQLLPIDNRWLVLSKWNIAYILQMEPLQVLDDFFPLGLVCLERPGPCLLDDSGITGPAIPSLFAILDEVVH